MDMSSTAEVRAARLGRRIRAIRIQKGHTIESFATALGYSWITVSRYERGKSSPSVDRLHEIADTLGVSVDELVSEDGA